MSTFNFKLIDKVNMPHVLAFICHKLTDYDTSQVEWIKLLPLYRKEILHGSCTYPVTHGPRNRTLKSGYRLRASVNVEAPPPYDYEHWGRIP